MELSGVRLFHGADCYSSQQVVASQQLELEPYLANLNVSEALEDFGRLADLVLSRSSVDSTSLLHVESDYAPLPAVAPSRCFSLASSENDSLLADEMQWQCAATTPGGSEQNCCLTRPSSPEGSSIQHAAPANCSYYSNISTPSSQWLSSSPPSPSTSSRSYSSFCSSRSSTSSSCYSSCPSSSSVNNKTQSRAAAAAGQEKKCKRSRGREPSGRRRQNATAAERYRKRLKGRTSGLEEQLEEERDKNSRLLASLESKMLVYREFAHLLAANTSDPRRDSALAQVGSRSLANVLESVLPADFLSEPERTELERVLEHFRQIAAAAAAAQGSA